MEKNYKISFYSKKRIFYVVGIPFFFFFLVSVPLIVNAPDNLIIRNILVGGITLATLAVFTLFPHVPKLYAKAIYQVKIDTEGILFENIKPILWGKLQAPVRINFSELKSYKYEPSNNFDMFRLRLKTGKKIRFDRYFFDSNDGFDIFFRDFQKTLRIYNKSKDTDNKINEENLIMNNKVFLWAVAVVLTAIIIGSIMLICIKGISNPKGFVSILVVFAPLVWVIRQIIKGLKK